MSEAAVVATSKENAGPNEALSKGFAGQRIHFKNFDIVRLIAASSVVFSHSYLIAYGNEDAEPFKQISGDIIGIYGVFVFFIVSGLLVTESALKNPGTLGFFWRRFLRLYPAYLVGMVLTLLMVGLFFYPLGNFWNFLTTHWSSMLQSLVYLDVSGWLDGIKFYASDPSLDSSHNEQEFNGSLWSLQMEIVCYIVLANLIAARWLSPLVCAIIIGGATFVLVADSSGPFATNLAYSVPSFFAGVLGWYLLQRHTPKLIGVLIALAILGAGIATQKLLYVFPLPAAYILLYIGVSAPFDIRIPKWIGDISYGAYLYGWPVQQVVRVFVGPTASWLDIFAWSMPIALLIGWVSWHLIERPALKYKNREPWNLLPKSLRAWAEGPAASADPQPKPAASQP